MRDDSRARAAAALAARRQAPEVDIAALETELAALTGALHV